MKTKGTTPKKICHRMNCFVFGLIAILMIIPSTSVAGLEAPTIISPPPAAGECPSISLSVDTNPAITFTWDLSFNGMVIKNFEMIMTIMDRVDDQFEIQYSPDGGGFWIDLEFNVEDLDSGEPITFSAGNETIENLQLRVNTDKVKKGDGASLELCAIKAELEIEDPEPQLAEPAITQSTFGIYEDVNATDFFAITPGISGDTRAQAIAIDDTFMYVAGEVPLGTVRGWRIEKRSVVNGVLDCDDPDNPTDACVVTVPNGGEPHAIVLDSTYIYVVGNAYEDREYRWYIEKRNVSNLALVYQFGTNGVIRVDPSEFTGKAYAAAIVGDYLLVAGSDYSQGNAQWRIEKRNTINGSLSDSITSNPGNGDDIPFAMISDGSNLYIGGYEKNTVGKNRKAITTVQSRIEKRSINDLSQLSVALSNHASETIDQVTALAVHGGYLYAAGVWEYGFWDTIGVIEKFDLNNFGGEGSEPEIIFEQDYGYDDRTLALAVWQDRLIAAGFSSDIGSGGDSAWRVDVLVIPTLELEYSVLLDINSHKNDQVNALAVDSQYMYLAGYQNPGIPKWHIQKRQLSDGSVGLPIDPVIKGNTFRSQILLGVDNAPLAPNKADFLLQIGECKIPQGCDSCEAYSYSFVSDVSPISWNSKERDGMQALIGVPEYPVYDLTFSGYDIRYQTFVEEQNFTNFTQINIGESGLWDFSLLANVVGTYCLRTVIIDDEQPEGYRKLDGYTDNQITIE